MTGKEYLNALAPDRKALISSLRDLIFKHDRNVKESVERMMGTEMLVYKTPEGIFKYALSSVKTHMSFHSMVLYCSSERFGGTGLREKYQALLPKVKFQKGCINFKNAGQMPLDIIEEFIRESAGLEYPPAIFRAQALQKEAKRQAARKKRLAQ